MIGTKKAMTKVYEVVCCNCGEVMDWFVDDLPFEYCGYCLSRLAEKGRWKGYIDSDLVAHSEVKIFDLYFDAERFGERIREGYKKRFEGVFQNPSHRRGKV
jgi:hypothetical protein